MKTAQCWAGASGHAISFLPNAYGEPRQAGAYVTAASYHAYGGIAQFTYGNGALRTVTPNLRGLPDRIRDTKNATTLFDHTLDYDENGNLAAILDGLPGGLESRTLSYDARNRLIGVSGAPTGNETYVYDPLDRLRQRVQAGVDRRFHYSASTTRLSHLAPPNALPERAYDWNERGELIGKRTPAPGPDDLFQSGFEGAEFGVPSQTQGYVFDAARRLTAVTGIESYAYDAHGHRTKTTRSGGSTRTQLYSRAGQLLYVEDTRDNQRIDYVHLGDTLVAKRTRPLGAGAAVVTYLHSDHRGTPAVESDLNGAMTQRTRLMPFGSPYDGIYRDGPGFTKHATDADTQLIYMQQRFFDSEIPGFISPDPVEANAEDFSRYAYAKNNPYTFIDPDGKEGVAIWQLNRDIDDLNHGCMSRQEFSERAAARGAGAVAGLGIVRRSTPPAGTRQPGRPAEGGGDRRRYGGGGLPSVSLAV